MKKTRIDIDNLPFKKIIDPFDDIRKIIEGSNDIKFAYHTLPLACCELDTFPGYEDILKGSPVSLQRRHEYMGTHLMAIKAGIEFIEQDCRYARTLMNGLEIKLHNDYMASKWSYKMRALKERRELAYNISSDIKKFTNL